MKNYTKLLLAIATAGNLFLGILYIDLLNTTTPVRAKCSDFKSWPEAKRAYEAGAFYLDGDKDGVPCEALLW